MLLTVALPALGRCKLLALALHSRGYKVAKRAPLHLQHTPLPTRSVSSFHAQGYEIAKRDLLQFLEGYKEAADPADRWATTR